ncbi:LysR family transcriptional regulator [Burkholderia sp. JPY481]|uniref:LysR family transcriptional regulator n=1 Tax=Paraburkholderia sp. JPY465 TaxID=3042285 RepID=UPI00316EBDFE
MDTLGTLSIFVHAAETRNFTRTAQRLGLSASAIAKSIARLEDRMGIRLFHRSTRNVMLTHEGEVLLESCRRIIEELEMIEERFTRRGKAPSGRLRVIAQIPSAYLAPVLRKFIVAFPEIELDIEWGTGAAGLIESGFDVAICPGLDTDSRLMSKHLGYSKVCIAGAASYFERCGIPATPQDLAHHVCIHLKDAGKLIRWPLGLSESDAGEPPVSMAVSMLGALVNLVECGSGIACLPEFAIERQLKDGSMRRVLGDHVSGSYQCVAVWPSSRHMATKIRAFVDFVANNLFGEAKGDEA